STPLVTYWARVRNIIFTLLLLVIFSAAVVLIVTHGTNITVWGFIGKFIFIVFLITFSFAIIQLLYQLTDIVQGFFIKNPAGAIISSKDLLNLNFNYNDFQGFRLSGMQNDESAFIAINLTKITAITYYVMSLILLVRKVILWLFIIVSPIFPLLLLYVPIRNTAKIWIGEFFRWLLYAPLFTIFLSGLVVLWQTQIALLPFRFIPNTPAYDAKVIKDFKGHPYPTAINILLGGPGQAVSQDNSLNYDDTFIQYVVALVMLWAVILLPFLLLRIFLDYIATLSIEDEHFAYIKNSLGRMTLSNSFFGNVLQNKSVTNTVGGASQQQSGGGGQQQSGRQSAGMERPSFVKPFSEAIAKITSTPPLRETSSTFTENRSHTPPVQSERSGVIRETVMTPFVLPNEPQEEKKSDKGYFASTGFERKSEDGLDELPVARKTMHQQNQGDISRSENSGQAKEEQAPDDKKISDATDTSSPQQAANKPEEQMPTVTEEE
ncbi:MAG: hypothetical protein ACREGI_02825, partial [Candidatus Levyibacteriota bacterium]